MIRLRQSGVDEILIKRVLDWYDPGPGVFIQSRTAALFSPEMLFTGSTTGVWYDPSDYSTLFQDAAGTVPVTDVEQPVGLMLDKSGRGNYAFQSTSANRPTLSARYNLLTKTEQFQDTGAWISSGTLTITQDDAVAPNGTITADKFDISALNASEAGRAQTFTCSATTYAISWYVKPGTITGARIGMFDGANFGTRDFTFTTKTFGNARGTLSFISTSYEELANGWYRLVAVVTASQASASANIGVFATSTGTGWFWGADLRVANDALNQPAYQRVNTSSDYDTVGFKPYLKFNGTNQWLQTNSIDFTYGDKMFVCAGVRKLQESGSSAQFICELSADAGTNNGGLYLTGWNGYQSPNHRYAILSRGTASATSAETSASYAAPITNVISGIGNISGDQAILRVNGAQVAQSTADQGTGNFGNYPLYMGARAGASFWANIRFYGAVIAGKQASADEITNTETFINQKTGAY